MALMTAEQVCNELQIKKSYLYHLTHHKLIPFIKIGNHVRFERDDLNQWLADKKNGNGGEEDDSL